MEQQQFLVDELDDKIKMFKRNSSDHKALHRRLRYGSFGLTAMLSILSGLALYTKLLNSSECRYSCFLWCCRGSGVIRRAA